MNLETDINQARTERFEKILQTSYSENEAFQLLTEIIDDCFNMAVIEHLFHCCKNTCNKHVLLRKVNERIRKFIIFEQKAKEKKLKLNYLKIEDVKFSDTLDIDESFYGRYINYLNEVGNLLRE
jgi:hypothetical protein